LLISSYRGKQRRENQEEQETELVLINTGKATAGGKPTSTWARLIRRPFEVDPLRCGNCGRQMRIIAFVTDLRQVGRILEHIGEQTIRPPPLTAKTSRPWLSRAEPVDTIPDLDAYVQVLGLMARNLRRGRPDWAILPANLAFGILYPGLRPLLVDSYQDSYSQLPAREKEDYSQALPAHWDE
jgi:hypothetical protein